MVAWQWIVLGALVALPVTLMLDLHPDRERLDAGGRPLDRAWRGWGRRPAAPVGDGEGDGDAHAHPSDAGGAAHH